MRSESTEFIADHNGKPSLWLIDKQVGLNGFLCHLESDASVQETFSKAYVKFGRFRFIRTGATVLV